MNDINLSIFGATGSIGSFSLKLIDKLDKNKRPNIFLISGYNQVKKLVELEEKYKAKYIFIPIDIKDKFFRELPLFLKNKINIITSFNELYDIYRQQDVQKNFLINGIIGSYGIIPTFLSQHFGFFCGCANKESIIISYELFKDFNSSLIYPLDSEHNAIYNLLSICDKQKISNIYITGSGGKVFGKTNKEIEQLKISDLIKHPNWNMGKRITVDSSSGINKTFEFLEIMALFGIPKDKIKILIDTKSQIHAIIQDINNNYYASVSRPDMMLPISKFLNKIGIDINYNACPMSERNMVFEVNDHIKKTYPFLDLFQKKYDKNLLMGTFLIQLNSYLQDLLFDEKINFSTLRKLLKKSFLAIFENEDKNNIYLNEILENIKKFSSLSFQKIDSIDNLFNFTNSTFNKMTKLLRRLLILEEKW